MNLALYLAALATVTASWTAMRLVGSVTVLARPARSPTFSSSLIPFGAFLRQYLPERGKAIEELKIS
jgi:hypothetical protein